MSLRCNNLLINGSPLDDQVPGWVAQYLFDDSLADEGESYSLTGGSPTYATGKNGRAISSTSGSDTASNIFTGDIKTGAYSISCWTYFAGDGDALGNFQFLITDQPGITDVDLTYSVSTLDWHWELDNNSNGGAAGGVVIETWQRLSFVVGNGTGKLYIGSTEADSVSLTGTQEFRAGAILRITKNGTETVLIDDLRFYQFALTPSQLNALVLTT
jgi:hypothetical protein